MGLFPRSVATTNGMAVITSPHRFDIHRWWKTVERGIGIFLERELEGKSSNDSELPEIRRRILRETSRGHSVELGCRPGPSPPAQTGDETAHRGVDERARARWGKAHRLFLGLAAWCDTGRLRCAHGSRRVPRELIVPSLPSA